MTGFDVYLNGRKVCRAGVGPEGVLSAIVTWVRYSGSAAARARRLKHPREHTDVSVGGLAQHHLRWARHALKAGDEVTIRVVKADSFDPPTKVERRDPQLQEREQRKYYLKLKRKYERKERISARAASRRRPRR